MFDSLAIDFHEPHNEDEEEEDEALIMAALEELGGTENGAFFQKLRGTKPDFAAKEIVMDGMGPPPAVDEGQVVPGACEEDSGEYSIGEDTRWDSDHDADLEREHGNVVVCASTGDGEPTEPKPKAVTMSKKHD